MEAEQEISSGNNQFWRRICTFVLRDAPLTTTMSNLSRNSPSTSDGSPEGNNKIEKKTCSNQTHLISQEHNNIITACIVAPIQKFSRKIKLFSYKNFFLRITISSKIHIEIVSPPSTRQARITKIQECKEDAFLNSDLKTIKSRS